MKISYHGATNVGRKRKNNEDTFMAEFNDRVFLCAVADGVGGHLDGEVASGRIKTELEFVAAYSFRWQDYDTNIYIRDIFEKISKGIYTANRDSGSTVVALCRASKSDSIVVAWCGDSRAYRIRDDKITQLTSDQSIVGELLKLKKITKAEADVHPNRNIITNHLGINPAKL